MNVSMGRLQPLYTNTVFLLQNESFFKTSSHLIDNYWLDAHGFELCRVELIVITYESFAAVLYSLSNSFLDNEVPLLFFKKAGFGQDATALLGSACARQSVPK